MQGPAGVDASPGLFHALAEAGDGPRDQQGGRDVEQRDVAVWPGLTFENGFCDAGSLIERVDGELRVGDRRDSEVGRADALAAERAVFDVHEQGLGAGGQFIKPVHAVGDDGSLGAQSRERAGHRFCEGEVIDADELAAGAGGVRQRAEEIEDGAEAE